jgi:hypothetical protein
MHLERINIKVLNCIHKVHLKSLNDHIVQRGIVLAALTVSNLAPHYLRKRNNIRFSNSKLTNIAIIV